MTLTVSTRVLGKKRQLLDDFIVPPPSAIGDGDELRLRDVIEHVVRHEVEQFKRRQSHQRFDRCLSERQIADEAKRGKINPAGKGEGQNVDPAAAVGAALQAFEDGLYLVVIDEVECRSLDEVVRLAEDSRLAFIRLAFLAGA